MCGQDEAPVPQTKIRICVIDDHPVVREGLRELLGREADMEICAEASDCAQGILAIHHSQPDLAIVDIALGGRSGIDLIKEIRGHGLDLPILVLSVHAEPTYAERALRAGAQGYILKENAPELITRAIRFVMAGEIYVCERMASKLLSRMLTGFTEPDDATPVERLTDRELDVLEYIARGHRTGEVAKTFHISVSTVEAHRAKIKRKLNLRTGHDLVRYAMNWAKSRQKPATATCPPPEIES